MTEQPLVSVIINCYNGEEFLRETIESVINQTYSNWELIFWDNQSTDSTAEIIKGYHDDRIRYFYAPTHTPLGEARNLAMKQVRGKYLAFLDSDDIWYPVFLKTGVELLENDSFCVGFYCNIHFHNNKKRLVKYNPISNMAYHDLKYLLNDYKIAMSGSLIRSGIVASYDVLFKRQYNLIEDYDFFLSLSKYGPWKYFPEPLMYYRVHSNSTSYRLRDKWAAEYDLMYNELKGSWVDKGLLKESDLYILREKYYEAQFDVITFSGSRKDIFVLLKNKNITIRLRIKCLFFFLFGNKYHLLNKIYWMLRR